MLRRWPSAPEKISFSRTRDKISHSSREEEVVERRADIPQVNPEAQTALLAPRFAPPAVGTSALGVNGARAGDRDLSSPRRFGGHRGRLRCFDPQGGSVTPLPATMRTTRGQGGTRGCQTVALRGNRRRPSATKLRAERLTLRAFLIASDPRRPSGDGFESCHPDSKNSENKALVGKSLSRQQCLAMVAAAVGYGQRSGNLSGV